MTNVIFVQPFTVNAHLASKCGERVLVLDVAFNAGSPQAPGTPEEQFNTTTIAFIEALGPRLVGWVDHHPHKAWGEFKKDARFVLVPRDQAPACPPLVTPEQLARIGAFDTIVAHGDLDGIYSAVKSILSGIAPYENFDADSIAADSRIGELSGIGKRYEAALKSNLQDDSIRQAIVTELTWQPGEDDAPLMQAQAVIEIAAQRYAAIQAETQRLADQFACSGIVAYVDATDAQQLDLTALLLAGQKQAQVAIVRNLQPRTGAPQLTVASSKEWDFVEMFGLAGGMPNRVNLPDQDVKEIVARINQA